jgi:excisionase family DNA binding protein
MQIYDVPQLSEMLKVSEKAVRSYLITGRLKGRKVGKRWLVHEDAVREFLMNPEQMATE